MQYTKTIPLLYRLVNSIGLSPALFLGTHGFGLGGNLSLNYTSSDGALDFGIGFGVTRWSNHVGTNKSFLEYRYGGQLAVGTSSFKAGISSNAFSGGGINQRVGGGIIYGKNWGIQYENDWFWGFPSGDSGDRWRTTGVRLHINEFSANLHFFTGDPGSLGNRPRSSDGRTYNNPGVDDFRLGSFAFGYKNFRFGYNSEIIRDEIQNKIVHKNGYGDMGIFKVMNDARQFIWRIC